MKICISDLSGNRHELLLNNSEPRIDQIRNDFLLLENYEYKITLRDDNHSENLELFIGDYSVPLHYNSTSDCYETASDQHFMGCFDLVSLSVVYEQNDNGFIDFSDYVRVATTKQTAKQVELMLDEIEASIPNSLDICFSKNHKRAGLNKNNNVRSMWNTLAIIDEIICLYDKNYSYFLNHRKSSVERTPIIVDVKSMKEIDQDSLRWIVCNPDNLERTRINTGIVINGDFYIPSKVKTYANKHSYDVYENRVILGFLHSLILYIERQLDGFSNELSELDNIPDAIIEKIPNTHDLTGRCIYIYYKGAMDKYRERKEQLQELLYKYERALKCGYEIVNNTPTLTNTFKEIYQYRACYECIVKWFEYGDYNFNHLDYLFKLKTLTRIFEYYCLIKLQSAISMMGYSLQETERVIYNEEDDDETNINNKYCFTGNDYQLTLLYEPTILTNGANNPFSLYARGYNFTKAVFNSYWTPDFVLKVFSERDEYYFILDSKYSSFINVKKSLFPELVLKYSAQIASMNKHRSEVIGIGALYPDSKDNLFFFEKKGSTSQKKPLPMYFALPIIGESAGTETLKSRLLEILSVVNHIEGTPMVESIDHTTYVDSLEGYTTNQMITSTKSNTVEEHQNSPTTRGARCKRCYYYGRSQCLFRGGITHTDNTCESFVRRNNDSYIVNNTCRNMVLTYLGGGRSELVCRVSGHKGCVGSDNCKYYQKKKKAD